MQRLLFFVLALGACRYSHHATQPSALGTPTSSEAMAALLATPGPVEMETVASASWHVSLDGLLNLDHPRAQAAGLENKEEPIQIYFHALKHPTRGLFVVDTGVESRMQRDPDHAAVRGMLASLAHLDEMVIHKDLGTYLSEQELPLAGVFLTHLHMDHIMGLPDVARGTPIYTGPGETTPTAMLYAVIGGTIERLLQDQAALSEWQFTPDPSGAFASVLDIFGDGTVFALHVPGHTPGSTAFIVRTPQGPVLIVGDASHTAWGWEHDVEPGSFTLDHNAGAASFAKLRAFAKKHPQLTVRYGHQGNH